jgi:hypothetical protein
MAAGVVSIMPFLAVLSNPSVIEDNIFKQTLQLASSHILSSLLCFWA